MILEHGRQLDWAAVESAADEIKRICNDACYSAPEDAIKLRELIARVCTQLNAITKALLITPPGARE